MGSRPLLVNRWEAAMNPEELKTAYGKNVETKYNAVDQDGVPLIRAQQAYSAFPQPLPSGSFPSSFGAVPVKCLFQGNALKRRSASPVSRRFMRNWSGWTG